MHRLENEGRREHASPKVPSRRARRDAAADGVKPSVTSRLRHSRSPLISPSPPKKKHRLRGEHPAVKAPSEGEYLRPGVPEETHRSELEFPGRRSPPRRGPDDRGFYRFKYGDNLSPRYKITSKLGEGTFGLVLEVWDRLKKRYQAMKIIRNVEKYRAAAMLELEALNAVKVNDPESEHHCVDLKKWFNYRGHVCMVFEKHGPSLYDFMKRNNYNAFDVEVVRSIGFQLLKAVGFLHDLRLAHTDLKPENILFLKDGQGLRVPYDTGICVIDFGSATYEDGHHGRIVSTRHYRAPEVVLGAKWSYGCDLWSVGCILVEFVTGETLFQTHEDMEHLAMMQQVLGPIPSSLAKRADSDAKSLFICDQLNWPDGASTRKSIRAVRRLLKLERWVAEVGHPSIQPFVREFVDLVEGLLRFEPLERTPAKEALFHKFFQTR